MPRLRLDFSAPLLNAAGSLGFYPDTKAPIELDKMGAFFTNPISLKPRKPANGTLQKAFSGGVLLHTGYPNPGFRAAINRYSSRWKRANIPIVPHLLSNDPDEIVGMVSQLEELENIMAVEIGLHQDLSSHSAAELVSAAQGELPVIARVPLSSSVEFAAAVFDGQASAISLGPVRGALPKPDGELISGRLFGPAFFPQALAVVRAYAAEDIAVIGAGGVYRWEQVEAMLSAGALAVQVDVGFWGNELKLFTQY